MARTRFESVIRLSLNRPDFLVFAHDVREAEELERLRLAEATRPAIAGGEPPELDQPRLLGVQFQAELREPVAQVSPEPLRVIPVLESHHEVVSPAHDDHVTVRVPSPPLVSPEVEGRSASRRSPAAVKLKPLAARPPQTPSTTHSR